MTRELLIDANLLCLLVVGMAIPSLNHPRVRTYSYADLETVGKIIDRFERIVLCPQVLTETSSLIAYRQSAHVTKELRRALAWVVENHN